MGSLVPRDTWRGQFHAGTSPVTGLRGDCTGATPTGCIWAPWPGWQTTASHAGTAAAPDVQAWFGGLVDGMRDASGQMYMRNRYYDPATGQFTQTDPIGLAGGLNAYGFAAGDPVTYSDPFGLCPESMRLPNGACPGGLSTEQWNSIVDGASTQSESERAYTMEKLMAGGYSAAVLDSTRFAETRFNFNGTNQVILNTLRGADFFRLEPGGMGWVLGHEHGHGIQNYGTEEQRRYLWAVTSLQLMIGPAGDFGRAFQAGLELEANRYACAHALAAGAFLARC